MRNVTDDQLEQLTIQELHDLKDKIDLAVRAVIRAKREGSLNGDPVTAKPRETDVPLMDLERERDAWLLAKR
jgi:hypothetical protein